MYKTISFLTVTAIMLLLTGCNNPRVTDTKRSYDEELLLSTAADNGVSKFDLKNLAGKRVKVDFSNLKSTDQEYVKATILSQIGSYGILIIKDSQEKDNKNIDFIIETFCGGLATNSKTWLLGIPSITVPIPLAGPVQTPEVAVFKMISHTAVGKFGFRVYNAKTGEQTVSKVGYLGKARRHQYSIVGIPWTTSNIPGM